MLSPSATHRPCGCWDVRSRACLLAASIATPVSRMSGGDGLAAAPAAAFGTKGLRLAVKSGRRTISAKSESGRSSTGWRRETAVAGAVLATLPVAVDAGSSSSPMNHQLKKPRATTAELRKSSTTFRAREEADLMAAPSHAGQRRYPGAPLAGVGRPAAD